MKSSSLIMNDIKNLEDRFTGALFGQAVGDALGLGAEFMSKKDVAWYYPDGLTHYDQIIQDAHRKRWKQGSWTDDTDQMTMILDSLLEKGEVDVADIARRFWNWVFMARGEGIGNTTYSVLNYKNFITDPHTASTAIWEESGRNLAANGGVMRTSVVGLWDFNDSEKIKQNAANICKLTHADPRCTGSCVVVSLLINGLVKGRIADNDFFDEMIMISKDYDERIQPYIETALNSADVSLLSLDDNDGTGYTLKCLSAGIWALSHAATFEEGLLSVINEGGDADTNASVAGALLGARFGLSSIPKHLVEGLTWKKYMDRVSQELFIKATSR
jgi:ADP-ribosylglycohydrolase